MNPAILLQKKLLDLRPRVSLLNTNFLSYSYRLLSSSLRRPPAAAENPPPSPPFSIEYLIDSCGLSSERASQAYARLAHLKSLSKPDAVLHFLKQIGLSAADIAATVSYDPKLLCCSVEKTLKPRTMELQEMGFSPTQIAQLISSSPSSLRTRSLKLKVEFWMPIFGEVDKLLKALRRNRYLLTRASSKVVAPNITFLQECGFSVCDIAKLFMTTPRLVTTNPDSVRAVVQRADELGVPRASGLFRQAVITTSCLSPSTVHAKIELLKSLGWSHADVLSAIRKAPMLLSVSEEKLRRNADFLLKKFSCKHSYISKHPTLLMYSLEQRLIPRHYVLTILKSKGLPEREPTFYSTMVLTDKQFKERFVLPYEKDIPGLSKIYDAACANRLPPKCEPYKGQGT